MRRGGLLAEHDPVARDAAEVGGADVFDEPIDDGMPEGEELDLLALERHGEIEGHDTVAVDPDLFREDVLELGSQP